MLRTFFSLAAAATLTLATALPTAEAQDGYNSGRNFYRYPNYTYSHSAWCAPSASGSFYCYPKGEPRYSRGDVGAYAKNTWRYGMPYGNSGATPATIVR